MAESFGYGKNISLCVVLGSTYVQRYLRWQGSIIIIITILLGLALVSNIKWGFFSVSQVRFHKVLLSILLYFGVVKIMIQQTCVVPYKMVVGVIAHSSLMFVLSAPTSSLLIYTSSDIITASTC